MEFLCSKSATITSQAMIKRRNNYEEDHAFPALLYPGDCVRPLPGGRSSSPQLQGVTGMEGIANFISMLDYVLDTKRKRHITGRIAVEWALYSLAVWL